MLAAPCILAFAGCATPTERIYRGEYFQNFENSALMPDDGGARWCLRSPQLDERLGGQGTTVQAKVVVRGQLSRKGHYCGLGAYERILTVTEVLEVSDVRTRSD